MASMVPPPPPVGGPPLPAGLPPPPLPMMHPAAPVGGVVAPPPPRIPFTATILLTSVPSFLHTFRAIRDWLYPCGSVRNAIFYPRKPSDDDDQGSLLPSNAKITVLITMSHPDGACKFLGAFKQFSSRLDERYNQIQAYMVPASPDVPLPPPFLDEETQQHLGEKLWQNFVSLESPDVDVEEDPKPKSLDVSKVAAAAGGNNYDADEDPLNAPQVLEAVKEFRRKLEKTHSFQKRKRMDLVAQKLAEMRPRVQAMIKEEKKRGPPVPPVPPSSLPPPPPLPPCSSLPAPPLPGGATIPPPPMEGLPAPPLPSAPPAGDFVGDSGKRGRSNLPAWMTQQQQQQPKEEQEDDEPPSKKAKATDASSNAIGDYPSQFPSQWPESTHVPLRDYLREQIQEYLGEEEATLIEFLHSHILQGKATSELLQELQMVLEEEASVFLEALWGKINQLLESSSS